MTPGIVCPRGSRYNPCARHVRRISPLTTLLVASLLCGAEGASLASPAPTAGPAPRGAAQLAPRASFQRGLSASPPWQRFVEDNGRWIAQWDEHTRTPRRAYGAGIELCPALSGEARPPDAVIEACALSFVERYAALAGVGSAQLGPARIAHSGGRTWVSLPQLVGGVPVEGASVELRLEGSRLVVFGFATHPDAPRQLPAATLRPDDARRLATLRLHAGPDASQEAELAVLPLQQADSLVYRQVWRVRVRQRAPLLDHEVLVDATDGSVLQVVSHMQSFVDGQVSILREPLAPGDPLQPAPLSYAPITGGGTTVSTTEGGGFFLPGSLPLDLTTSLDGALTRVFDEALGVVPSHTFSRVNQASSALSWAPRDDGELAALDAFASYHEIRARVAELIGEPALPAEPVGIFVNGDDDIGMSCNAYFAPGKGMVFLQGKEGCANFARLADIVYHEYGHAVHRALMVAGNFDGAVSEGTSDYLAASLTGSPIIGGDAYGPATFVRELLTDKQLPWDLVNQVHTDGLIWGGALWDLRTLLMARDGAQVGRDTVDRLLLDVLIGGPTLWDLYTETLFIDDDDGDLSNGTPNLCEIDQAFAPHGLGDGLLGIFSFGHTQVADQSHGARGYEVTAQPSIFGGACAAADLSSLTVYHKVESGPWVATPMSPQPGGAYAATLPAAPPGSTLTYDLVVWDAQRDRWASLTGGRDDLAPRFYVGDMQTLWCDDAEADIGWTREVSPSDGHLEWDRDIPLGLSQDPPAAFSGQYVWGTNLRLTANDGWPAGRYRPNQTLTLTSPLFDASALRQMRVSYQRWLTVEDGAFDQARITAGDTLAWSNLATDEGLYHTLDQGWFRHSVPIWGADGSAEASVSFVLRADDGLEFGGWNIDDVCVSAPTDLPGRYAIALSGELLGDGQLRLAGVLPWANPLQKLAIVRGVGAAPRTVGDGVTMLQRSGVTPGDTFEAIDPAPPEGQQIFYRAFVWDGQRWWPEGQAGPETWDTTLEVATPTPLGPTPTASRTPTEVPTPSPTPEASPTSTQDQSKDSSGCSCAGARQARGLSWVGWLLLGVWRRRRAPAAEGRAGSP